MHASPRSCLLLGDGRKIELDLTLLIKRGFEGTGRVHKRSPFEPVPDFLSCACIEILDLAEKARQCREDFNVHRLRTEAWHCHAFPGHSVRKLPLIQFDVKPQAVY